MRLAIVQAGLGAGGTERVVSLLAADRCRRGDEVHLFAFVGEQDKSYFALHPKVTVHRLVEDGASRLSKLGFVRSLRRVVVLRAEFKQLQPTLIVSFLTKINILCLLAAKNLGIRVIISERNNPKAQKKHAAWRLVSGIILRQADRLVMQTDAIVKTLPDTLRKKPTLSEILARSSEIRARRPMPTKTMAMRCFAWSPSDAWWNRKASTR